MAFGFILVHSCGPAPEEEPEPTDDTPAVTGYATDKITHKHVMGTDPCPQDIKYPIQIFCYKDGDTGNCTADSASIDGHSDGLNVRFINGKKFVRLATSNSSTDASLEFTCGIAESFDKSYTVNLFKDGNLVTSEQVLISTTVE